VSRQPNAALWTQLLLNTLRAMIGDAKPYRLYRRDGALYLERWKLEKNDRGGIYLHHFVASDDVIPHDHPRRSTSLILAGSYIELIRGSDGCMHPEVRTPGDVVFRRASHTHRIELADGQDAWSLFMFGPHVRQWGFVCPTGRWMHWKEFTGFDQTGDSSVAGKGCD
jgi:hypothetical protein